MIDVSRYQQQSTVITRPPFLSISHITSPYFAGEGKLWVVSMSSISVYVCIETSYLVGWKWMPIFKNDLRWVGVVRLLLLAILCVMVGPNGMLGPHDYLNNSGDQLSQPSRLLPKPSPVNQVVVAAIMILNNKCRAWTMHLCMDSVKFVLEAPGANTLVCFIFFWGGGATILSQFAEVRLFVQKLVQANDEYTPKTHIAASLLFESTIYWGISLIGSQQNQTCFQVTRSLCSKSTKFHRLPRSNGGVPHHAIVRSDAELLLPLLATWSEFWGTEICKW